VFESVLGVITFFILLTNGGEEYFEVYNEVVLLTESVRTPS